MDSKIFNQIKAKYSVSEIPEVNKKLSNKIKIWEKKVTMDLMLKDPFFESSKQLKISNSNFKLAESKISAIKDDLEYLSELCSFTDQKYENKFWENELIGLQKNKMPSVDKSIKNVKIIHRLLLQKWERILSQEYVKWELSEIEKHRLVILSRLEKWLDLLQTLQDTMDELGLETGLLFDLSKGNISLSSISELQKWAKYIAEDEGVKQLCDMLGRLRRVDKSIKKEVIMSSIHSETMLPDYTLKEEIVGIKLGSDIEYILPQELALLGDNDTSILFDKKFIDGELMCFDMLGYEDVSFESDSEAVVDLVEEEKLGPMIICVDTSGSMSGSPEIIAKSITLFLATRAKKQNRDCYLINFSTSIEIFDFGQELGFVELLNFLQRSFHGGTDVAPALNHAIQKMQEDNYSKSDILIISDFIMSSLPTDIESKITEAKLQNNKFYSLSIGNIFLDNRVSEMFDKEWVYNPNNTSITQLNKVINDVS